MSRGRIHTQVADLLDRTVRINGDLAKLILKKWALEWGGRVSNPLATDYQTVDPDSSSCCLFSLCDNGLGCLGAPVRTW